MDCSLMSSDFEQAAVIDSRCRSPLFSYFSIEALFECKTCSTKLYVSPRLALMPLGAWSFDNEALWLSYYVHCLSYLLKLLDIILILSKSAGKTQQTYFFFEKANKIVPIPYFVCLNILKYAKTYKILVK